ncbi:hypothetical protein F4859DRAFT_509573 [Xylaria cf. heliscus]|nr:hypothetical protein F4859DRAFT_509573 [Xylaria cf. heliscus]
MKVGGFPGSERHGPSMAMTAKLQGPFNKGMRRVGSVKLYSLSIIVAAACTIVSQALYACTGPGTSAPVNL